MSKVTWRLERARPIDVSAVTVAVAFLLPTAFSPGLGASFWTPKMSVLLVSIGFGLPVLIRLLRTPERPAATAATCLCLVAVVSATLSPTPTIAVTGHYNVGTGAIFVIALACCWALGVAGRSDSELVERVLIIAAGANAAAAFFGLLLPVDVLQLVVEGRAIGLQGNAVHLGAFAASSVALAPAAWRWRPAAAVLLLVGAAASVQVSGTRLSLVMLVIAAALAFRRLRLRVAAASVLLLFTGLTLGWVVAGLPGTSGTGATARIAAGGHVPTARIETWRSTLPLVFDRTFGTGPGTFRSAASPHRTMKLAQVEGADRLFRDAHNLVIEYSVTTGIIGAGALIVSLVLACWRGAGPLLYLGLILLAHGLLEPQWPGTTPLALLALGAAGGPAVAVQRGTRRITAATASVPVLLALWLLVADMLLLRARQDFSLPQAAMATRALPMWPEGPSLAATIARVEPGVNQLAEARRWRIEAVERDPRNPRLLNDLADLDQKSGRLATAELHYREALRWDPVSLRAHAGLGRLMLSRNRTPEALHHLSIAVQLGAGTEVKTLCREAAAFHGTKVPTKAEGAGSEDPAPSRCN